MNETTPAQALTELVKGTCRYPEHCHVSVEGTTLRIVPHMADYPLLIGKGGRQINALKYVANCMGQLDVVLDESFIGKSERSQPFAFNREADTKRMVALLQDIANLTFDRRPEISVAESVCDAVQGSELRIEIEPAEGEEEARQKIAAIGDLFYPYSFRQGFLMKIKPVKHQND